MNTQTKETRGPKVKYGERKPMLTRVPLELAAEFESYCASASDGPITVTEGLVLLIEAFCKKKREQLKGAKPKRPESAGPAPTSVTITALLSTATPEEPAAPLETPKSLPKPSNKSSPWTEIERRLRAAVGEKYFGEWGFAIEFVSLEHCKLSLWAGNPYFLEDLPSRVGELLEEIASELCGEPISVSWALNPVYEEKQRQYQAEQEAKEQAERDAEAKRLQERGEAIRRLRELYQQKTPIAAKEAEEIIFHDILVLESLPGFIRKQIEQWLSGVGAGAAYQSGKESNYRGPNRRAKR